MPHLGMASCAGHWFATVIEIGKVDLMHHPFMAFAARFFGLLAIPVGHLDRFMKIASGKGI